MIENLKIALRRQKRLVIIFVLAVFLPAISLSIFGIRAIKNEKFRLAKQVENEDKRALELIKTQASPLIREIESTLQKLARSTCFSDKDCAGIGDLLGRQTDQLYLVEQVFVVYNNEEPRFPLFQNDSPAKPLSLSPAALQDSLLEKIKKAEDLEFKDKNYQEATDLYKKLTSLISDKHDKAQMLNNAARCLMKSKNYLQALKVYRQICKDYPGETGRGHLPLDIFARLQILDCYKNMGDLKNLFENSLVFYRDILENRWILTEDQFLAYSHIAEEEIRRIISENAIGVASAMDFQGFEKLKSRHQKIIRQWQVVGCLRNNIIPELRSKLAASQTSSNSPLHFSKMFDEQYFVILAVMIPGPSGINGSGILGVKIQNEYFLDRVFSAVEKSRKPGENMNIIVSDLSGRVLSGRGRPSSGVLAMTGFFEDNFPPWKIDLFRKKTERSGLLGLRESFYFWTILTLIVILTFGTFLIVRTIAHEMEVLKIKSDFVSSISHEFKTPLTSIKALTERLQEGKVKEPEKMNQYFSIISQDTERLSRLVRNILDFSKIEEGKREYEFVETDVAQLVAQQIEAFSKDVIQKGIHIEAKFAEGIPALNLDREAIGQALNNLLDNAVKFSPDKKDISVAVKSDQESLRIEVQDQGIGIRSDELNKIFDKFYQGKDTRRLSAKGAGLGLTLVKHIVEAHGGRVSVESAIGQGSTFSLVFPIRRKEM
jgi:signal transduction histidine kinase/tetratricopeptide (TPR) repeat protein